MALFMAEEKASAAYRFITVILVLFVFFPSLLSGESSREEDYDYRIGKTFFVDLFGHTADVLSAPCRWNGHDFLVFSSVLAGGALAYWSDEDVRNWVLERKTPAGDDCFDVITFLGDGRFLLGLISALYASGEIAGERSLRKTAVLSLESLVASSAVVWILKSAAGRSRPYTDETGRTFHPFSFSSRYHSFPSGHSSAAFSVATIIALQSESLAVDILSYSLAAAVACSRVYKDVHWFSDVLIGSAVGHFTARRIFSLHQKKNPDSVRIGVLLLPEKKGITLSYSF